MTYRPAIPAGGLGSPGMRSVICGVTPLRGHDLSSAALPLLSSSRDSFTSYRKWYSEKDWLAVGYIIHSLILYGINECSCS